MSKPATVLPPDPHVRKPKRALPAGTVDCHAHIFDRFDRYPFAGERKYQPPLCSREAWLALHATLGVGRGVQVHGSPYGFNNSITYDFLRGYPGRFVAVGVIRPDISDEELKRMDERGFRAARLMDQFATGATTAMLEDIARRVAPFGWHIEINIAKSSDWVAMEPRLRRCPVPLVFDHLGRTRGAEGIDAPGFKVIRRLLAERDDCWTKVSSFYRLSDAGPPDYQDMRPFVEAVLRDRPDRCVWGTNWPHPGLTQYMPNDTDLLDLLESWLPNDAVREQLFVNNAVKLYRF
jgi:predicted TIM-barrel fold metal-dependent hydrolase